MRNGAAYCRECEGKPRARFPWRTILISMLGIYIGWLVLVEGRTMSFVDHSRRDLVTPPVFAVSPGQMQYYRLDKRSWYRLRFREPTSLPDASC